MKLNQSIAFKKMENFKEIIQPLLRLDKIKYFIYSASYQDDSRIYLCDNPDWFLAYHEELYSLGASNRYSSTYVDPLMLWSDFENTTIFQIAKEQFGMNYPALLINPTPESCEIGIFGLDENIEHHASYVNRNKKMLQAFLYYFKDAGRHLINAAQTDRKILPKVNRETTYSDFDYQEYILHEWLKENTKRFFIGAGKTFLTRKEIACIHHTLKGKSAKQIANILNLSSRTIETHFEKSKRKLKAENRFELIYKAIKFNLID